jgi:hypothetical protein
VVEDDLVFLARFAGQDVDAIVGDEVVLAGIKYRFITAMEGCAKAAHHLSASEGWPVAEANADAARLLAQQGVLGQELAASRAGRSRGRPYCGRSRRNAAAPRR